jgi:hypothetical protein
MNISIKSPKADIRKSFDRLKMRSTYANDQDIRHRLLKELQEHHKVAENVCMSKVI